MLNLHAIADVGIYTRDTESEQTLSTLPEFYNAAYPSIDVGPYTYRSEVEFGQGRAVVILGGLGRNNVWTKQGVGEYSTEGKESTRFSRPDGGLYYGRR
jgi:hypothetical protein